MDLDDFVETDSQHRVAMDDLSVRLRIFIIKYRGGGITNLNVVDCEDVIAHHLSVFLSYLGLDHDEVACHVPLVGRVPYSLGRVGVGDLVEKS